VDISSRLALHVKLLLYWIRWTALRSVLMSRASAHRKDIAFSRNISLVITLGFRTRPIQRRTTLRQSSPSVTRQWTASFCFARGMARQCHPFLLASQC